MIYGIVNTKTKAFEGWISTKEELLLEDGYLPQYLAPQPAFDEESEILIENPPIIEKDHVLKSWRLEPLPVYVLEQKQEKVEVYAEIEKLKESEPVIETVEDRLARLEKILAFKFS